MRYFYYTNENSGEQTVIIVKPGSNCISLYPSSRTNYSSSAMDWLDHYKRQKEQGKQRYMFEICENQFKKFQDKRTKPDNWDW